MGTVYLTLDQVLEYQRMALGAGGGAEGLRSYEALASAVYQARQTFGGEDLYSSVAEKAAAYGFFIAESQAFLDGNKRTAAVAMLAFLDLNGHEFYQTDEEMEEMFVAIGRGETAIEKDEFFGWVCNHTRPKPAGNC